MARPRPRLPPHHPYRAARQKQTAWAAVATTRLTRMCTCGPPSVDAPPPPWLRPWDSPASLARSHALWSHLAVCQPSSHLLAAATDKSLRKRRVGRGALASGFALPHSFRFLATRDVRGQTTVRQTVRLLSRVLFNMPFSHVRLHSSAFATLSTFSNLDTSTVSFFDLIVVPAYRFPKLYP